MDIISARAILEEFLSMPISNSDEIFRKFASLPGAIFKQGHKPLQRFVFIPGSRKTKVVLVAHADTVWDISYEKAAETTLLEKDGVYYSSNPNCGIGADDRAGCAMLWALRQCGHSLLLVDGEEHGKFGAGYLRRSHPLLYYKLNRHQFMIELDWFGTDSCSFNQVENTQNFKDYFMSQLQLEDGGNKGGCDLQVLCLQICGANLGVGYHSTHRPAETLVWEEWCHTLQKLDSFLKLEHPRFPIPIEKQLRTIFRLCKGFAGKILRRLGVLKQRA